MLLYMSQYIMNTDAVVTEHVKDSVTVLTDDHAYSPAVFTCVDRKQKTTYTGDAFCVSLMFNQC